MYIKSVWFSDKSIEHINYSNKNKNKRTNESSVSGRVSKCVRSEIKDDLMK